MHQEDYIIRMVEQLSIFIRKLLKLDINIDKEQYIIEFEKMLTSNLEDDLDNLNMDILNKLVEDGISKIKLAVIFYKASIAYFPDNIEVSFKCHQIAKNIENFKVATINPFINNDQVEELFNYKKESVKLHE